MKKITKPVLGLLLQRFAQEHKISNDFHEPVERRAEADKTVEEIWEMIWTYIEGGNES